MGKRIAGKGGEMKKKYKYILAGVVAAVFVVAAAVGMLKPIAVELETVASGSLETELTVQGTLIPIHSTLLSAGFQGAVREMPHQAGTALKQGEMILRMGYESQAELELSREQYRQQLTSAKQTYENLFGDHGSAPAALAAARSDYELARKNYENGRALAAAGSISQIELDVLANQYSKAEQAFNQASETNSEGNRKYYEELIASYEKQLETLEQVANPGEILMPYDGVIWELYPAQGQYVTANEPVAKIYQPGDMKIQASLLTEDAVRLTQGQTVSVRYADGTVAEAEVGFVSAVAGQTLSTIGMEENRCQVEFKPERVPELAGAGHQVDVTCTLVAAENVLSVPSSAIVPVTGGSAVYVRKGGKARLVQVETGKKSGGRVEITGGLAEHDVIVADPYEDHVKDGSRITGM